MTDWMETDRTRMRPFEEADAEEAFAWFSDLEVMKFIPSGVDATLEDTRRRIARYREHQARFGFSKRLIIDRETDQAIGDSGLFHLPDGKRIELGFRLARPYWGVGDAAEVGRAWLNWFDAHLAGEALFADVHFDHVKSQRVLGKLGFHTLHSESVYGMTMLILRRGSESGSLPGGYGEEHHRQKSAEDPAGVACYNRGAEQTEVQAGEECVAAREFKDALCRDGDEADQRERAGAAVRLRINQQLQCGNGH